MRILITGITGFVGGFLAEEVLGQAHAELWGVSRRGQWPTELQHLQANVGLRSCDLGQRDLLLMLLEELRPERIYHLAGYAHVGRSFREPDAAWSDNLEVTRNLYEAILKWGGKPRVLHVSSGMIYGDPSLPLGEQGRGEDAFDESAPLQPLSPYAVSKAAADLAAYQYARNFGLDIVRVRPFNHIGPRQSPQYAISHFAKQIAALEKGLQPPIVETGDLSPRRDFTDVRDMVRAYTLLMDKGRAAEAYNAGTGTTHSMQEVLDKLLALAQVRVEVRQKADLVRAAETLASRADAGKLQCETGWSPRFTLEQTLADILEYWRKA